MAEKLPITAFDMLTLPVNLQMLKAMVPFFDYPLAKMLSMIIRINELNYTIQYFRTPNRSMFSACGSVSLKSSPRSLTDLLENEEFTEAILPYCPPEYAGIIKNFKTFSKMSELFNIANAMNTGGDKDAGFGSGGADFGFNPSMLSGLLSGIGGANMPGAEDIASIFASLNNGAHAREEASSSPPQQETGGKDSGNAGDENGEDNGGSDGEGYGNSRSSGYETGRGSGGESGEDNVNSSRKNSGGAFNNFLNTEQQKMYDEYIKQLDFLDSKLNEPDESNDSSGQ